MYGWTFLILLALLGLIWGSFVGAQVWRIRARQLRRDEADGLADRDEKRELKRLNGIIAPTGEDRSRCLHCGHILAWYDLVPLASWLSTSGKCRYCHKPIGWFEPAIEIGTSLFFLASYVFWIHPLDDTLSWAQFLVWLVSGVILIMLLAYDAKWFLLPDGLNIALALLGAVFVGLELAQSGVSAEGLISVLGALAIMSGIYAALYYYSRWRYGEESTWVGFGDVKLGIGLGLLLVSWEKAFVALFLANLIGCLFVIPGMLGGKLGRKSHVPFGPFLIIGTILAVLFGQIIIDWYFGLTGQLLL